MVLISYWVLYAISLIQDSVTFGAAAGRHVSRWIQDRGVRVEFVHVAPVGGAVDPATSLISLNVIPLLGEPRFVVGEGVVHGVAEG